MVSVKKNFIYSSILTISNYIFPLLTFPYVSRVLGVENMGIYNFVDSIVQYFTIFSMLGISTIGIREIAKVRNDYYKLSRTYSSLLTLNLLITLLAIIVLLVLSYLLPQLHSYQEMIFIGGARLLFNALLVEWFYKGIENFRYITLRSIFVRFIYVAAVFILVRSTKDYVIYFALTALTVAINAIINIIYSSKFARFSISHIDFRPYIKPLLILGVYQILTSMYTSFNVMYLGFVADDREVGYYTTSVKLFTIILSIFTAFTGVMLPRMSSLYAEDRLDDFKVMIKKSIDILFIFVMPLIVISEVFAPQIIQIMAGNGYEGAILPMRIIIPLMLVIGYEQILVIQILSPMKKDRSILINSIWGGIIALTLNIILIKTYFAVGSSVVWVISELVVLTSAQYFVTKFIGFRFPFKRLVTDLFTMVPILIINITVSISINKNFWSLLIGVFLTSLYYFVLTCFVRKNQLINGMMNSVFENISVR